MFLGGVRRQLGPRKSTRPPGQVLFPPQGVATRTGVLRHIAKLIQWWGLSAKCKVWKGRETSQPIIRNARPPGRAQASDSKSEPES